MDIIVLVKEVPDLTVAVQMIHKTGRPDPDDIISIPNPSDLTALALAVKCIENTGSGTVTALFCGPSHSATVPKRCLQYGADRAIHIQCENVSHLENRQVATILTEAIRRMRLPYDLIFSGQNDSPTLSGAALYTGKIGAQVAALLGLPHITGSRRIDPPPVTERKGQPHAITMEAAGNCGEYFDLLCKLPVSCTIRLDSSMPAKTPLDDYLVKSIETISMLDLDIDPDGMGGRLTLTAVGTVSPRTAKVMAPPHQLPASERIRIALSGGRTDKQSDFLEGPAEEIAQRVGELLINRHAGRSGGKSMGDPFPEMESHHSKEELCNIKEGDDANEQ